MSTTMSTTTSSDPTTAPTGLEQARHAVHAAVQIPAAAAHALAAQQEDFSHTTLQYRPHLGALVGAPLADGPIRLGVRFGDLSLLVLGAGDEVLQTLNAEGHTLDSLRSEVSSALAANGIEGELPWLTHDMPAHPLHEGGVFAPASGADLSALEAWFARAEDALAGAREAHPTSSPIRCWPHHFDTAVLIPIDTEGGETARSVGVGMSPGDGHFPQPYWYVSPWPAPEGSLPPLGRGRWHREGFTAAVLDTRGPEVDTFLDEAIAASFQALQASDE